MIISRVVRQTAQLLVSKESCPVRMASSAIKADRNDATETVSAASINPMERSHQGLQRSNDMLVSKMIGWHEGSGLIWVILQLAPHLTLLSRHMDAPVVQALNAE